MSTLSQLYQETLLAHAKQPRNYGQLANCTHCAHGKNPLCGDDYMLELRLEGEHIAEICFHGDGCAISKASASLMTMLVGRMDRIQALKLCKNFTEMLVCTTGSELLSKLPTHLQIFSGVREYPMRIKCATLIWRTLESLLHGQTEDISSEDDAQAAGIE